MKKKFQTVKNILGVGVGIGVTTIVRNIIDENSPEDSGTIQKLCTGLAAVVIGSMACDKVIHYMNKQIDTIGAGVSSEEDEIKESENE
jgi:hypothetical protein